MRPRATDYESVITAASRCIAAEGIRHTTVDDVAEAAGVSRATVYRHVGGKRTLVQAVLHREVGQLSETASRAARVAHTPAEAIRAVTRAVMAGIAESPVLQRVTGSDLEANLALLTGGFPDLIRGVVEDCAGSDPTGPLGAVASLAEDLARFLMMMVHTPTLAGDHLDPDAVADRAVRVFGPAADRQLAPA